MASPESVTPDLGTDEGWRTVQWMHTLSAILGSLLDGGLRLDWLHEHPRVTWQAFAQLAEDADGCWAWPDRPWLPLAVSLSMTRT